MRKKAGIGVAALYFIATSKNSVSRIEERAYFRRDAAPHICEGAGWTSCGGESRRSI